MFSYTTYIKDTRLGIENRTGALPDITRRYLTALAFEAIPITLDDIPPSRHDAIIKRLDDADNRRYRRWQLNDNPRKQELQMRRPYYTDISGRHE